MREQAFDTTQHASFTRRGKGQPSHLAIMCGSCPARPSRRIACRKRGTIESVIRSAAIDNDEGAVARTVGVKCALLACRDPDDRDLAGLCRLAA